MSGPTHSALLIPMSLSSREKKGSETTAASGASTSKLTIAMNVLNIRPMRENMQFVLVLVESFLASR
ncbi:hypothetical protein EXN61_22400 [Agrobacterium tumefaciens]|uniref:Uncharacterized protein n=1 Tax=Agrobacterium tumefaciens TaxID=358 RepID=A0A546XS79_AGRTU|nr:hypothetical protein [Agrobacterium tumefaciens]TRB03602.1 hypothetical protein EXN61_22400 [Agrobacterium tumefaciens]